MLFPNVFLPLHIFEPRYREMVRGALATDRIIGMVLLRPPPGGGPGGAAAGLPGGRRGDHPPPAAAGRGRLLIMLRGGEEIKMTGEDTSRSYRLAHVEAVPDAATDAERAAIARYRQRLESWLRQRPSTAARNRSCPRPCPDQDLVNALAQYLVRPARAPGAARAAGARSPAVDRWWSCSR